MIILLTAYLVGYFISFGTCLGVFEKTTIGAYFTSFVWGFTSWVGIGMFMADFIKEKIKTMSNLTPELQKQIADEADKYGFVVPYNNSKSFYIQDKVNGYAAGATPYAIKWQEAELRAERYEKALREIEQQTVNSPELSWKQIAMKMKAIAVKVTTVTTPKISNDDTTNR